MVRGQPTCSLFLLLVVLVIGAGTPAWARFCPACGAAQRDTAKFCDQCGQAATSDPVKPGETGNIPGLPVESGNPPILDSVKVPAPQPYQVTTSYLLVNGYRIPRNSLFWIAEITGSRARVWCVNQPEGGGLIMGWVALTELEKRSTLQPGSRVVCVEPPPPTEAIVIIHRRSPWYEWHRRPYPFVRPPRHHSRDRDHHRRR